MAKENFVFLVGQVRKEPVYQEKSQNGSSSAMFPLMTVRRDIRDESGAYSPKWDRPLILTTNPVMIEKIKEIRPYDIVEVKGSIRTRNVTRAVTCPNCGKTVLHNGMITVINPIYIGIRNTGLVSDAEGYAKLVPCAEISNIAKVIGRVCSETIDTFRNNEGALGAKYQIAVNRKLYIEGTDPEDHSDYPWVFSYGSIAEEDQKVMQQGSMLYLDGYIHTIGFTQHIYCDNEDCLEPIAFRNQSLNITPHSCEYLENCNLPDPIQRNIASRDETMEYGD